MNFKRSKVVILPTNNEAIKKGELVKNLNTNELGISQNNLLSDLNKSMPKSCKFEAQYLYILSYEEIQVGDWYYRDGESFVSKCDPIDDEDLKYIQTHSVFKKVIASTDPRLNTSVWDDVTKAITTGVETGKLPEPNIKGLPRPSKAFIQKYVELQGIDEVMVEYYDQCRGNVFGGQCIKCGKKDITPNKIGGCSIKTKERLKVSKDNTITIKPIKDKGVLPITGVDEFGFGIPLVHRGNLQTWSSSLFVKVNGYTVSFAGDDGNRGKLGDVSVRHYLNISDPFNISITKSLGFKNYDVTFNDFLKAIEKVKNL